MAEFNPDQLDILEDALEQLADCENLEGLGHDPTLTARLGEYQDILQLSRTALAVEEPPAALLAGVMAEARQSGAAMQPAGERPSPKPFFLRWLPAFALAASAAGVLWWMKPGVSTEIASAAGSGPASKSASATGVPTLGVVSPTAADAAAKSDNGTAQPDSGPRDSSPEEAPGEEGDSALAGSEDAPPDLSPVVRPSVTKKKKSKPGKSGAQKLEPTPAVAAGPALNKEEAWDRLTRAHSLRRRGECARAQSLYAGLTHDALPENLRAQARAGRGLCNELDGKDSAAESEFSAARTMQRDIDGWIGAERDEMQSVGLPSKRKAKKASAPAQADFEDPMQN